MFPLRGSAVKKRPRQGSRIAPDLHDPPSLTLGTDVVPEERGVGRWVVSDAVEKVGCVLVHAVVDDDCFVLKFSFNVSGCINIVSVFGYVWTVNGRREGMILLALLDSIVHAEGCERLNPELGGTPPWRHAVQRLRACLIRVRRCSLVVVGVSPVIHWASRNSWLEKNCLIWL